MGFLGEDMRSEVVYRGRKRGLAGSCSRCEKGEWERAIEMKVEMRFGKRVSYFADNTLCLRGWDKGRLAHYWEWEDEGWVKEYNENNTLVLSE